MFSLVAETHNTIQILKAMGTTFEKQINSFQRRFYLRFVREEESWGGVWEQGHLRTWACSEEAAGSVQSRHAG